MKVLMIGLGKMGGNMAERLRRQGHEVVGYDAYDKESTDAATLPDAVALLGEAGTRVCWSMVPAGPATDQVVTDLADLLAPGDVVVDGGNSNYHDSMRHGDVLAQRSVGFIDCGTSGGVWGVEHGYCLMVGGSSDDIAKVQPLFDALAPEGGFIHAGPSGAGHFTKMVHNGIEYGIMQAFAEGFALLERVDLVDEPLGALRAWQHGSIVQSWLLELLVVALERSPDLRDLAPVAKDSGEGRWMVEEAVRLGVATPVIAASLFARFTSQAEDNIAMKVVAALRREFGGHAVELRES